MMMLNYIVVLLLLVVGLVRGQATQLHNVSVDDPDSSIVYSPPSAWSLTDTITLDFPFTPSSSHHLTSTNSNPGAHAVFTFTGVAVYYFSPKWPYAVNSFVTLNGEPGECIDMFDPFGVSDSRGHETVVSAPLWFRANLPDTVHTVTVSACPGGQYIVVDGFIYSVLEAVTSTSSVHTSTSAASTTFTVASQTATSKTSKTRVLAIAIGAGAGGLGLLILVILLIVCCVNRRKPRKDISSPPMDVTPANTNYSPIATPPGTAPVYQTGRYSSGDPFTGQMPASGQLGLYAPYDRWSASSPSSHYTSGFTGQGSDVRRPDLPEL